ncbi:MAG: hypothetical protein HWQ38_24285 [Nostoc sp. NMS7]|uniref:hypothetical protein n=1 Tax=Nostoc sp. NMS7 TaxID=2815391 RepID=UPI0025DED712|nr:hypothetical protein [Nostoc sp. NMS7]MBN3949413.1 hypothetical protein [Nostoc sp. NMS7]
MTDQEIGEIKWLGKHTDNSVIRSSRNSCTRDTYAAIGSLYNISERYTRLIITTELYSTISIVNPSNEILEKLTELIESKSRLNKSGIDRFLNKRKLNALESQQGTFKKGNSKLSEVEVSQVKYLLQNTSMTAREIASLFDVSAGAIYSIKYNKAWFHVPAANAIGIVHYKK